MTTGPRLAVGRSLAVRAGVVAAVAAAHLAWLAVWLPRLGFSLWSVWLLVTAVQIGVFATAAIVRRPLHLDGPSQWTDVVLLGLLIGAAGTAYTWVKLLVPALNPALWDARFAALDLALCLGVNPNVFLLTIFEANPHWVGLVMDAVYNSFLVFTYVGFALLGTARDRRLRVASIGSLALLWLAGAWWYVAQPSLGPALVWPGLWVEAHGVFPHAAAVQRDLMNNYTTVTAALSGGAGGAVNPFYGVGAMPSLHVAAMVLLFLWSLRWRPAAWVAGILAGLVFVGSVATGWHYLVDSLAGILLALACWAVFLPGSRGSTATPDAD